MRRIVSLALIAILILSSSTFGADLPEKVIATAKAPLIKGNLVPLVVEKVLVGEDIFVRVVKSSGELVWKSEILGSEDKKFIWNDKAESLKLVDLTGDGVREIVTAVFYGPRASGLYIFKSVKGNKFVNIPSKFPKENIERDCLVADMHQDNGYDMVFLKPDTVQILGMQYSTEPEGEPCPAYFLFALKNGVFVFQNVKKIPPPK